MIEHRSLPRLSFALFCVWLSVDFVGVLVRCGGSSRWGVRDTIATALLASGPAIVLAFAALASTRSDTGLAFAGGLAVGAVPFAPIVVVTTVVAIALGRRWDLARERVPLAGLGVLIGLCVCGLTTDLAASVAPVVSDPMHWWAPDPVGQRVPRAALELATLAAAIAFARGRTWGALAIGPLVLGLVRWSGAGPMWGGGCMFFEHPLPGSPSLVLVPTLVAILPWAAPIARALTTTETKRA